MTLQIMFVQDDTFDLLILGKSLFAFQDAKAPVSIITSTFNKYPYIITTGVSYLLSYGG